jgi:hypothetical protein
MVEPLRQVLVRRPPADTSEWRRFGRRAELTRPLLRCA